ncbi:MAG TPA: hypothetical protein VK717_04075 [Opitutaceae bacterium]|jgi:hypothetical protein|nr:hypothetical protein [Opitutaceae bacterium]
MARRLETFLFAWANSSAERGWVRRTFSITCLLLAWVCANGAIWDVVQMVAWTRMFAEHARALPVGEALRETFDPAKPCAICLAVAKAKDVENKQAPQQTERSAEKLLLACQPAEKILLVAPLTEWPEAPSRPALVRTEPVPVPPPRSLVA